MNSCIYRLPQATFDYVDKNILNEEKKAWEVVRLIKLIFFSFNLNFLQIQLKLMWQLRLTLYSLNEKRILLF